MHDFQPFLAPAKINLFLHITGQRADGYHELQTIFRLLDFYDTIYLKPTNTRSTRFMCTRGKIIAAIQPL